MKTKKSILIICFAVAFYTVAYCQDSNERPDPSVELPLRSSEPIDSIIEDLKEFIPDYIHTKNIPGVQIALIQKGKVAWSGGFGVTNTITDKPVTPNTLFEVASNSKVVTAYMALRLVDEGKISMEKPLHSYLGEEWLPPSEYRDSIKLNHVLSHTSGLAKTTKEILFKPGTAYFYSANGLVFTKEVLENVTGESFDELAKRLVFDPLGMTNSSFSRKPELIPLNANGHINALVPVGLFTVLFTSVFIIVVLVGTAVVRLSTLSWKLKRLHVVVFILISIFIPVLALFVILGRNSLIEFAWICTTCGFVFTGLFFLCFYSGRKFILKTFISRKVLYRFLSFVWGLLITVIILFFSAKISNLPVPRWPGYKPGPAGTLRTSAQELALFMIELSNPKFISPETAEYIRTPQIKLSNSLSWGMGPGILYSNEGYALWQWGQHIDFQSIMIIYPEQEFGAVVCTNNDLLKPDVALEIAHHALGGIIEPVRSAVHLQYDYHVNN
jgi:CubicO group peptidase (beta-lactamase class C family)